MQQRLLPGTNRKQKLDSREIGMSPDGLMDAERGALDWMVYASLHLHVVVFIAQCTIVQAQPWDRMSSVCLCFCL